MDGILEGANAQEVAAPDATDNQVKGTVVEESMEGVSTSEESQKQSDELNDKFVAEVRRKAEEDSQKRFDERLSGINGEIKRLFGNLKNPVTGKNIETYEDYIQAVEHQQKTAQEQVLREKGIDPTLIEQMVNSSPAIRQAQQILAENNRTIAQKQLESDLKIVSQIAPEVKSLKDLENHTSYGVVLNYVNGGLSLPEAFKLANFDTLSAKSTEAAKQAAINQARSKNHMETTSSVASGQETLVPIPDSVLSQWKRSYPDLTMEQLTKKYNSIL